jgi:NTP pyrophosphatase (non-canonical NTP hydrolase)
MDSARYLAESARTVSPLAPRTDLVSDAAFGHLVAELEAAAENADRVKRALFYGAAPKEPLPESAAPPLAPGEIDASLLHAALGLATEAVEFLEAIAKPLRNGQPLDTVNLIEEMGDLEWYLALAHRTLGSTPETVRSINIAKLRKRFPDRFTENAAVERNLDAERAVLETSGQAGRITAKEAAAALDGNQYREEGSKELFARMKEAGLVAVFGASDDLLEFRGAIDDEIGAYEGTTAFLVRGGLLVNACDDERCPEFAAKKKEASTVEAIWAPKTPDVSWLIKTNLPHETFEIKEDDETYCLGLVLSLSDCAKN